MVLGLFKKTWSINDIPDQSGKVAIVTGGNSGLGYVTCLELARHHAKVYMASRTKSRVEEAIQKIKKEVPDALIEFLEFDLSKLSSCKAAAEEFLKKEDRLDILVNNAGVMATPYKLSDDGIEIQSCNGTGHFALTIPLLPLLKKTDAQHDSQVRIVNLTSIAHRWAEEPNFKSLEGLNMERASTWARYGNSKLSNILFNSELQRRLEGSNIHCLAVHPGVVDTGLNRGTAESYPLLKPLFAIQTMFRGSLLLSPRQGALTQLYAATSPEITTKSLKGAYLVPYAKVEKPTILAQDLEGKLALDFWNLCEKLVAEKS